MPTYTWTTPVSESTGHVVDAAEWDAQVVGNMQSIALTQNWVPTIGGTGWAKGNGTITTAFTAFGNRVELDIAFVLGSTSTGGTGGLTFSAPTGAVATGKAEGSLKMEKGGAAYAGTCEITTTTIGCFCITSAAGQLGFVVNGAPSAGNWATGDALYLHLSYFV